MVNKITILNAYDEHHIKFITKYKCGSGRLLNWNEDYPKMLINMLKFDTCNGTKPMPDYQNVVLAYPETKLSDRKVIEYVNDIAEAAINNNDSINLTFYTNNNTFINQFRLLVCKSIIKPEDVEIIHFDKDCKGNILTIDINGDLSYYPNDYFNETAVIMKDILKTRLDRKEK